MSESIETTGEQAIHQPIDLDEAILERVRTIPNDIYERRLTNETDNTFIEAGKIAVGSVVDTADSEDNIIFSSSSLVRKLHVKPDQQSNARPTVNFNIYYVYNKTDKKGKLVIDELYDAKTPISRITVSQSESYQSVTKRRESLPMNGHMDPIDYSRKLDPSEYGQLLDIITSPFAHIEEARLFIEVSDEEARDMAEKR